ncbi:MAG: UDP-N-acetylmuramate--L-alanine ligase [Firmicutes bacterium]|nr:UDP-N-acetylmuramate--L-alanine ligase [Bacillota bacterium]
MTAADQSLDNHSTIHFIGIGGAGMSAIAHILLDRGYQVSGSDVVEQEYTRKLQRHGATVWIGHQAKNVAAADLVVYSTAVNGDNPELQAAREAGLPVLHRSEMLAMLMAQGKGIAVAGAHGKTTTTSMIAFVLTRAGLDPSFLVGGVVANLDTGAHAGKGDCIVAEADESDGSFLNYRPHIAVITNIEADHLEHYGGDFQRLQAAYEQFARLLDATGLLVTCIDDLHVQTLLQRVRVTHVGYSLEDPEAALYATVEELSATGSRSRIYREGVLVGELKLNIAGRHNVGNALAAIAVATAVGVSFAAIAQALAEFRGALRRFQTVYDDPAEGVTVVDDYAHHPTEIRAAIRAMKADGRRLIAVFQPQRYTRTFHLFDEFAQAFGEADDVVISDIYSPVGETVIAGVNSERLCSLIRDRSNGRAVYCPNLDDVVAHLKTCVQPGDLILTMGAGDIWRAGREFAKWHESRAR